MKNLLIIFLSFSLVFTASAQRSHGGSHMEGGHFGGRSRVVVAVGGYAPYWGFGYGHGYPWGYPGYVEVQPSQLELQIDDIKSDYKERIWSARHDHSLKRDQRRQTIHQLKHEREEAIIKAKEDYYHSGNNEN